MNLPPGVTQRDIDRHQAPRCACTEIAYKTCGRCGEGLCGSCADYCDHCNTTLCKDCTGLWYKDGRMLHLCRRCLDSAMRAAIQEPPVAAAAERGRV